MSSKRQPTLGQRVSALEEHFADLHKPMSKEPGKPLHLGVKTIPPPQFRPLKEFDLPVSE